ncbi:hypothetical protein CM19_06175 [Candidatus Acidianus copahuensis]|uniref:Uncharacterized protein n=1 Tax=Candidatus Acidianus copahuensis TaxID=1160895 RepID=A0A031LRR1_9CREN|nr:hypothetical protein CM19_06175 [Candidatus Acidianus copahuensis]
MDGFPHTLVGGVIPLRGRNAMMIFVQNVVKSKGFTNKTIDARKAQTPPNTKTFLNLNLGLHIDV